MTPRGSGTAPMRLLKTRDNPAGWRLEEILKAVRLELEGETVALADDPRPCADRRRARNLMIVGLLLQAEGVRREDLARVVDLAPERPAANDMF